MKIDLLLLMAAISCFLVVGCKAPEKKDQDSGRVDPTKREPPPGGHDTINASTIGNGGDAVVCRNEQGDITSAEVLDVFEGRELYQLEPVRPGDETDPYEYLSKLVAGIDRLDSHKHTLYQKKLREFAAQIQFVDYVLTDIPDYGSLPLQPACDIEQLAIQIKTSLPRDKAYIIDREIWESLSVTNKAALVLHEIVYYDAIQKNHQDSRHVRRFNQYVFSRLIDEWTAEEYQDYMINLDLLDVAKVTGEIQFESPCVVAGFPAGCLRIVSPDFPRGGNIKYIDRAELDNTTEEFRLEGDSVVLFYGESQEFAFENKSQVTATVQLDGNGTTIIKIAEIQ